MSRRRTRKSRAYSPTRGRFAGRRFRTRWAYQKALAATRSRAKRTIRAVRTSRDLDALSELHTGIRSDVLQVIHVMRLEGLSLRGAVRKVKNETPGSRVTERAVLQYGRTALRKRRGRWTARKSDRLIRRLRFLTERGQVIVDVKDSGVSAEIARYWSALDAYSKGDLTALRRFRGRSFTAVGGKKYRYITSPKKLDALMEFGETQVDGIYERGRSGN
jgi:hypothetical protein